MKRALLLLLATISLSVAFASTTPAATEQMEMLQRRSQFTNGGIAMVVCIGALLVFLVVNNRWQHRLEVKNLQLQRERNVVVAQNKQLAIERDRAEIEVIDGRLTGRFLTPNCYGQEKVRRILTLHPDRSAYHLTAYGDSRGDREMLAFADEAQMI